MHSDLIVIGMGLTGLMAARTAAEKGLKVLLVAKGMGSLSLFSNTIDVLGSIPTEENMRHGLSRWIQDHPEHPYGKVGTSGLEDALTSFQALFPPPYCFQSFGQGNSLVPTGAGTRRPTYLIPVTMMGGIDLKEAEPLIVGFSGFKDFYASYVSQGLRCRAIALPLREASQGETSASALARLLEQASFRRRIGTEIREQLRGESKVGLPAVLGLRYPVQIKMDLEQISGAEVFEIPTLPPSIPGRRIFNTFREWLIHRGVTFLMGFPVSKASISGKRCQGVYLNHPPVSTLHTADRFILATGRFLGGGLTADGEGILEPIFDLPVFQPQSRLDWYGQSFFDGHSIHRAGILTDSFLRPVGEGGDVLLENLWVAGSILSHHNSIEEISREGIEIATGYMAAKLAMER
jgi:glycerol-3-phosphate dehydrogenase subunit B